MTSIDAANRGREATEHHTVNLERLTEILRGQLDHGDMTHLRSIAARIATEATTLRKHAESETERVADQMFRDAGITERRSTADS